MSEHVIELEKLSKVYRDKRLKPVQGLQELSLQVRAGEAFGFAGPNGAGKSTTIKILTGILRPTSGHARIHGVDTTDHRARRKLGYVPENPYLYDYLTPLEMLRMGARMRGMKGRGVTSHCMGWLERFGLGAVAKKRIRTLSKGMTQRVALGHAMVGNPELLILDEPLSGLDPIWRQEVVETLIAYRNHGGTLFFSSHVLTDVEQLGDRFGIIHRGRLRTVGSPTELRGGSNEQMMIVSLGTFPVPGARSRAKGGWETQVKANALWNKLHELEQAQHRILEIRPAGLRLEQAFMRFIQDEDLKDISLQKAAAEQPR
ncbi:MAG: ABC transporter ATP-binding protein [Pseudomonadota bacterium]